MERERAWRRSECEAMETMIAMSDPPKMRAVTYTLSEADLERLAHLIAWRHPDDPKAASMTVRECIREAYERERGAHPDHGDHEEHGDTAPPGSASSPSA